MIALLLLAVVGGIILIVTQAEGRRERIMTPLALFLAIEVLATWPALAAASESGELARGWTLALLAGCATLTAVIAYLVFGGMQTDATYWRDDAHTPSPQALKKFGVGIAVLTTFLVGLAFYRFHGVPPLFNGGLRSLIDPAGNADQVSRIREGRRLMTKGYLLGQQYQGQGILNTFSQAGWQVVVAAAVLRHTWVKTSASRWQLVAVGVMAFLVLGSDGKRAPLALACLAGAGALAIRHRVSTRVVGNVAVASFAFLLFISPLSKGAGAGGAGLAGRAEAVVSRVTQGNGQNNVAIVELIDNGRLGTGHGSVFVSRLLVLIPGAPAGDPFALTVTRLAYGAGKNTTGFSTPTQFGLLYADAKDVGVLLGYALTGALMAIGWRRLTRSRSHWGAIFMVQGGILLGYMAVTGVQGAIASLAMSALAVGLMYLPSVRLRSEDRARVRAG